MFKKRIPKAPKPPIEDLKDETGHIETTSKQKGEKLTNEEKDLTKKIASYNKYRGVFAPEDFGASISDNETNNLLFAIFSELRDLRDEIKNKNIDT